MRFRLAPRSMTLDDLKLYKFEFSENFSGFRRFRTQQQLNEWRCQRQGDKHVELEQFWHASASRGFVSDSCPFLFIDSSFLTLFERHSQNFYTRCPSLYYAYVFIGLFVRCPRSKINEGGPKTVFISLYTVGHKETRHFYFFDNSDKYWPIVVIFLLLYTTMNCGIRTC